MGIFSRKSKSASSQGESSYSPPSSQPFNYSQYPDEKIVNPGGYPVHTPPPVLTSNNYSQPQQSYQQPSQQYAPQSHNYHSQQPQGYGFSQHAQPQQYSYQSPPQSTYNAHPQQHYQQQQQQQVVVNIVSNSQPGSYQQQTRYQSQQNQQQQHSQGIPRCGAGHECERHTVSKEGPNKGRLFWRCRSCNRFVVWDNER